MSQQSHSSAPPSSPTPGRRTVKTVRLPSHLDTSVRIVLVILLRLIMTVIVRNVTASSCHQDHFTDTAARTQTATIQMTVSAEQDRGSVLTVAANLSSNILSQHGRLNLLYCIRFVFASLHSLCICFIAQVLFFLHASLQDLYKQYSQ